MNPGQIHAGDDDGEGGFKPERGVKDVDAESMRRVFEVNTFGLMLVAKHVAPLLIKSAKLITTAAKAGGGETIRLMGDKPPTMCCFRRCKASATSSPRMA